MLIRKRLAMRVEGEMWNAYCAEPDTMDGKVLLLGVRKELIFDDQEWQDFYEMAWACFSVYMEMAYGVDVGDPVTSMAPAHERMQ